jgi:hypothetical protein
VIGPAPDAVTEMAACAVIAPQARAVIMHNGRAHFITQWAHTHRRPPATAESAIAGGSWIKGIYQIDLGRQHKNEVLIRFAIATAILTH